MSITILLFLITTIFVATFCIFRLVKNCITALNGGNRVQDEPTQQQVPVNNQLLVENDIEIENGTNHNTSFSTLPSMQNVNDANEDILNTANIQAYSIAIERLELDNEIYAQNIFNGYNVNENYEQIERNQNAAIQLRENFNRRNLANNNFGSENSLF